MTMTDVSSSSMARTEQGENEPMHFGESTETEFAIPRKPISRLSVQSSTDGPILLRNLKDESNDVPRDRRTASTRYLSEWLRDWRPEAVCCVLFVGALMAIVGAILPYQDRPLPHWPYSISINTLISILIAIAKTAMRFVITEGLSQLMWTWFRRKRPLEDMARFDMASRGPWGSLRLLPVLRGRDLLASAGAVVMIASIAIDPFAQVRLD